MDRLDLHEKLVEILGSRNVYFQPPSSLRLTYPCIVYKLQDIDEKFANDKLYIRKKRYIITIIDTNPDSLMPDKIAQLPLTTFDRYYPADNLNHYVYLTYF